MRFERESRRIDGLNRTGLVIVAVAALIRSLNATTPSLFSKPFAVWFTNFSRSLWVNFAICLGILLAAVWARRRHPIPGRAQYATALWAVFVATLLAVLALEVHFYLLFAIVLAALWAYHYPGRAQNAGAITTIVVASVLGALVYDPGPFPAPLIFLAGGFLRYFVVGMVITAAWLYTCTEADDAAAIAQCAVDSARLDEQTAEARLQMLEAQIEPHFLFNTLAHVKRLYETDRAAGARMLDNLEAYLAVALPQMRASGSTLGRELDHATAYLDIQQIRMGHRLAYAVDVDHGLRAARLPSLMLLTLVENAIKHGLTPVPAGGRIDICAFVEMGRLRVEVADTGRGFTQSGGAGTGLANIRARLAAQFGQDASLALALNSRCGVVATITLPYQSAGAGAGTT